MPSFWCWIPDYGQEREDAREVSSYDGECAARDFVEWYERKSAEYPVAGGSQIEVMVESIEGEARAYVVYGECRPYYYAWSK